ncbi:MAG: nucleotidyltransferase domain-containing protein [Spirosomaceae bacterium]|jgi:predicted nucleotidyltransferase|nr:nucleotidyltransferase domain-containing protein [Spirosomataceae bacterium]
MLSKKKFIEKVQNKTHQWLPNAEVFLFGSRARGTHNKFSDWDLLVLLNTIGVPFETETKLMDLFYELELETGTIISPLIYSKEEWTHKYIGTPLYQNIEREGIRLQ